MDQTSKASQSRGILSKLTLTVVAAGSLLSALDLFIVNIAFPSIRDSFSDASNQSLSWVLSAYSIVFAALLVPSGRMGDRFGRRNAFRFGLIVFAIASAACAFAPNVGMLIAARTLKGAGAALMIPSSIGLLLGAYPPSKHKQMLAIWAAIASVGAALGPVLGGLLVHLDWRYIFLINLPIAIPAIFLCCYLQETERGESGVPDILGSVLFALGTACVVAAISYFHEWGALSHKLWVITVAGVAMLSVFIYRCNTARNPALDLRVFRIPAFSLATIGMLTFYTGFSMSILAGSLYLTQVWAWDPARAGIAYAIGPALAGTTSILSGRGKIAPRTLTLIGSLVFVAASLWWLTFLGDTSNFLIGFLPGFALSGIAAGMAQAGFLAAGTAVLSPGEYSAGSGILNTSRQIGGALGIALLVALTGTAQHSQDFLVAFWVISVTSLAAAATSLSIKKSRSAR
ncbi:MFS transporter [Rhizobium sp. BE258]|uniref:MFS transporter n=1 Tax=Rhizobium sp. BE258 TaxID=2817722 RepID=UPI002862C7AD|nr:MFS transporter [Rhizobium sp. BE258]MDR7145040.1 EmrB/QacA subfamily drug resistance transporter [Rhizobium sp. BE258]